MKKFLIISTLLAISSLLILIFDPFNEIEKGQRRFFETALRPANNYIKNKLINDSRLPSDYEFKEWVKDNYPNKLIVYHSSRPPFMKDWCAEKNCYVIGAWNGDNITYYKSWDDSFFYGKVE